MQLDVFFPTNAVHSLKRFISATSNANFYLFLPLLGFREESCQDDQRQFFERVQPRCWFFFCCSFHPRNTWTDLWLGMTQNVTIKSSSCQDSPDYFTCSFFFDGFLQEMHEVRTTEVTETSGACWRKDKICELSVFSNSCCHFSLF